MKKLVVYLDIDEPAVLEAAIDMLDADVHNLAWEAYLYACEEGKFEGEWDDTWRARVYET